MSLKEIARITGVSKATVSRMLNDPDYIGRSRELHKKVWDTAIELHYRPNLSARNLKLGKQDQEKPHYINILMTRTQDETTDPFFLDLLRNVEQQIHRNSYILSYIWYNPIFSNELSCDHEDLDKITEAMIEEAGEKADALIIMGKCTHRGLEALMRHYENIISISRNPLNEAIDEVISDGKKISATAISHLHELGHTEIGYVGIYQHEARYLGYLEEMQRRGLQLNPAYIIDVLQTREGGFQAMTQFLSQQQRPSAIYCANAITAIGMIECMRKNKRKKYFPSIIASDDIEEANSTNPTLTTVSIPREDIARLAVLTLADRIEGGHKNVLQTAFACNVISRASTRRIDEIGWYEY